MAQRPNYNQPNANASFRPPILQASNSTPNFGPQGPEARPAIRPIINQQAQQFQPIGQQTVQAQASQVNYQQQQQQQFQQTQQAQGNYQQQQPASYQQQPPMNFQQQGYTLPAQPVQYSQAQQAQQPQQYQNTMRPPIVQRPAFSIPQPVPVSIVPPRPSMPSSQNTSQIDLTKPRSAFIQPQPPLQPLSRVNSSSTFQEDPNTFKAGSRRHYPEQQMQMQMQGTASTDQFTTSLDQRFQSLNVSGQHPGLPFSLLGAIPPIHDLLTTRHVPILPSNLEYMRSSLNVIPRNSSLLAKTKAPFGVIISPYSKNLDDQVPTISGPITRCTRCRGYINPFIEFVDQGTRWKCNMCFMVNDVPTFFDIDSTTGQSLDRSQRPELNYSVVEFLASVEYTVRTPQPPMYLFVIDVTYESIANGMLATISRTILETLEQIPNETGRTKVGFLTFDGTLHFYNLNQNLNEPSMLIVSDIEDLTTLPFYEDILTNLNDSKDLIQILLEKLPRVCASTRNVSNCFGVALEVATRILSNFGGTILGFTSSLPNIGKGLIKPRDEVSVRGTVKESKLLEPENQFYKDLATECSKSQTCINLFLFPSSFIDISTLSCCAKYTGGNVYFYPNFNASRSLDAIKVASDLTNFLKIPLGYEAVIRVRASKGLTLTNYHGSFFLRSSDLLACPNVNPENSLSVQVSFEENLIGNMASFQTAVLHTNSLGERRIRVINYSLPISDNIQEIFLGIDQLTLTGILAHNAIEKACLTKLEDAREALTNKCAEILAAYRTNFSSSSSSSNQNVQLLISENLRLFPLLILGLLKTSSLKSGTQTSIDSRAYQMTLIKILNPRLLASLIHPNFYALHLMEPEIGTLNENGQVLMPLPLNLSSEKLERHGFFLLEDGQNIYLWVGSQSPPTLSQAVFDKSSYETLESGKIAVPLLENSFSLRLNNILGKIKEKMQTKPFIYLVKEDSEPFLKFSFLSFLIEDKSDSGPSYQQFVSMLRDKLNGN